MCVVCVGVVVCVCMTTPHSLCLDQRGAQNTTVHSPLIDVISSMTGNLRRLIAVQKFPPQPSAQRPTVNTEPNYGGQNTALITSFGVRHTFYLCGMSRWPLECLFVLHTDSRWPTDEQVSFSSFPDESATDLSTLRLKARFG